MEQVCMGFYGSWTGEAMFLVVLLLKQSVTYAICFTYVCVCVCVRACVCVYVDQNLTPSPGNGISTGNSLISSQDLGSPQKFNLDWYSFSNRSLQITLLQIWSHFKNEGLLLLQTITNHSPNQNIGITKMLPPAGEEGPLIQWECMISKHNKYHMQKKLSKCRISRHNKYHMQQKQSECRISRHN